MIPRHAASLLDRLLVYFPCTVISGVRQCGKTTLLETLPEDWRRFDMERAVDRQQVLADPDLFLRLHPRRTAIDEAQLVPDLFPALRVAIDRDRTARGCFVVTGSSSPDLVRRISESLAGRVGLLELSPLTMAEAWELPTSSVYTTLAHREGVEALMAGAAARLSIPQIFEYWFHGGYPEPWLSKDAEFRRLWHRSYLDTYLMRDIGYLFPNLNQDRYRQLIALLSQISGSIINKAEIARTLGVSEPTVRDWLQIAHGTFLWRHLPAWDRSPSKQLVKHPKGFLRDTGLLHRLLRLTDVDQLMTHPVMGRSWEGMVVETLLRGFENAGYDVAPYHYRTRGGAEIDLILEGDFGLLPVEIKLSLPTDGRFLRALHEFVVSHDCPVGLVITNDDRPRRLDERIVAIPAGGL